MEALREWLMGVVVLSVLWAAADSLMPEGGVKKVGKLAGTVAILCVVLEPLAALRDISLTDWTARYREMMDEIRLTLEEQTGRTQKSVIEEHCASYISDKAAQLGVVCRVEVDCAFHADGLWLPERVRLWGKFSDVQRSRMTELLTGQLGVAWEELTFYITGEGES